MTTINAIPPGYVMRANGDLSLESNLTTLEREEEALVRQLFPQAEELNELIGKFKYNAMRAVETTVSRCIKEHGIKRFEKIKGNVQFVTVDGKYKVERAINEKVEYNSSIEAARQLFDQYASMMEEQAGSDAREMIKEYFRMNNNQFSVSKLIEVCNKKIEHPIYKQAVGAMRQALFVGSSKAYLRFYIRSETDDSWVAMPLQFSSIDAIPPEDESQAESKETEKSEQAEA